jgi:hypothetical protein
MSTSRFRLRQVFWLDMNNDDEAALADTIDELKRQRSFVRTVRDGIRLICDLRQGRVDVLFELFPWVRAEFLAGIQPSETPTERAISEQLKRLETLMLQQGNMPIQLADHGGPKAMNVPQFDPPAFDDDEDTVVLKRDTTTNSAQNFINSMLNLQ